VVGSNDAETPTHLSVREPALFDQLVALNIIKRFASRTFEGNCGVGARPYPTTNTSLTSSALPRPFGLFQLVRRVFTAFCSLFGDSLSFLSHSIGPTSAKPFFDESGQCHFKSADIREQCVIERPAFRFQVSKPTTIKIQPEFGCSGSFMVLPGTRQLFLLVLETECPKGHVTPPTRRNALQSKHDYRPARIPDCLLTKPRRRFRLQFDFDPETEARDQMEECSGAVRSGIASVGLLALSALLAFRVHEYE